MNLHIKKLGSKNYIWDSNSDVENENLMIDFLRQRAKKGKNLFLWISETEEHLFLIRKAILVKKYDLTINVCKNQFLMNFWRSYGKKSIFFIFHWFCLWYKPLKSQELWNLPYRSALSVLSVLSVLAYFYCVTRAPLF